MNLEPLSLEAHTTQVTFDAVEFIEAFPVEVIYCGDCLGDFRRYEGGCRIDKL